MKQVATAYHGVSVTKMWHLKYLPRAQGIAFKRTHENKFRAEIGINFFLSFNRHVFKQTNGWWFLCGALNRCAFLCSTKPC